MEPNVNQSRFTFTNARFFLRYLERFKVWIYARIRNSMQKKHYFVNFFFISGLCGHVNRRKSLKKYETLLGSDIFGILTFFPFGQNEYLYRFKCKSNGVKERQKSKFIEKSFANSTRIRYHIGYFPTISLHFIHHTSRTIVSKNRNWRQMSYYRKIRRKRPHFSFLNVNVSSLDPTYIVHHTFSFTLSMNDEYLQSMYKV